MLNFSDFSSYPVTLYLYDATGTTPDCIDVESFDLTLNQTPIIDGLSNQTVCNNYELPVITGTNLTGSETYNTASDGSGTSYSAGTVLNFTDFSS